jgi:arylsulfatase A-like enzyme
VIVLILDATRASSCGFAGHHRDTTPTIDAVAAGASVFTRATAQAPYTVCSVPTMLTGVGFHSHLVQSNNGRLTDGETTLAEVLADHGYRTLGFSATPNNSPRVGTGQGYEVFDDVWRLPDFATAIDPHVMADRVVAALDESRRSAPAPDGALGAAPRARTRPWSDSGCGVIPPTVGPCDGEPELPGLSMMDWPGKVSRRTTLPEIKALYDGNLLAADDALGQVVEVLKSCGSLGRRDRGHDTSDHGEAFFEHGRHRSHNSTVYEEMLHVPVIVKRSGQNRPEVSDRLMSLEDLVPTHPRPKSVCPCPTG